MKKLLFFFLCVSFSWILQAQVSRTVNVTAGKLYLSITTTELNTITSLTLSGTIDARDFKFMRDKLPLLAAVDLRSVTLIAYEGDEGTNEGVYKIYPANTIPEAAFSKNTVNMSLNSVVFPPTVTCIGKNAFNSCNGLTDLIIPSSVAKIEHNAFSNCKGLKTVILNSSLVSFESLVFANCFSLNSITLASSIPYTLGYNVFYKVDKSSCIINVPFASGSGYRNALQWSDFQNIREASNGFTVSTNNVKLSETAGSNATITVSSNVEWTASSDQDWLVVNPTSGNGLSQTITLTANENPSYVTVKKAFVTISAHGVEPQVITVTQSVQPQSPKTFSITAGGLRSALTDEELGSVSDLTLSGTMDARDFKTIRDHMPLLAKLDISKVTIVTYEGPEGTMGDNYNYFYPANAIPVYAFFTYTSQVNHLVSIVLPDSLIGFAENTFNEGLTSMTVLRHVPLLLNEFSNLFSTIKDKCTLYVPYGTAPRYRTAAGWKDFVTIKEVSQGFSLSLYNDTIEGKEGTTIHVNITANVNWSITCDQEWLTVNPASGNANQTVIFKATANELFSKRKATVTITGEGVPSQIITFVQDIQPQPEKILELTPGTLASVLSTDELNTISVLTLKGTIDARDFRTMRDKMPLLATLDLSGATIVAYNGTEGPAYSDNYYSYMNNEIPEKAFYAYNPISGKYFGKFSLTSVVLPATLTSIAYASFAYCKGLTNIVIPASVTAINTQAFYHCEGLINVIIPSSVKAIKYEAFGFCTSLTSVTIPYGVESIENSAFWFCSKLASVTISSSVTKLGSYTFYECLNLKQVTVNWSVPLNLGLYTYVFSNNQNTKIPVLNVPFGTVSGYASANQWKDFINIKETSGFFLLAKEVKLEQLQGSTASVGINSNVSWTATCDQPWLSVSPTNGTGMGEKLSFTAEANSSYSPRIAKVTVSSEGIESQFITVTQLPVAAIVEMTAGGLATTFTEEELKTIKELTLTGTIDARDFKTMRDKMPLLSNVDISGATIVAYSGSEGTRLSGGSYAANVLPEAAFYRKTTLTSVKLPLSITAIEKEAFDTCTGLIDMIIPEGVSTIGAKAFYSCTGLKTVIIPSSVVSMESACFRECTSLTSLTINNSIPPVLSQYSFIFYRVDKNLCVLKIPYASKPNYRNAYQWDEFFNIVEPSIGFGINSNKETVAGSAGSKGAVAISANIEWTASSDQEWLTVSPSSGNSNQLIIFTANVNPSFTATRTAYITLSTSVPGVASQRITVTQSIQPQPPKTLEVTPGELAAALTADELATITDLTLTGNIDARDFKILRDRMPLLSKVNLSSVTIVAYNGTEGTSNVGNTDYPANTIPEYAFVPKSMNIQDESRLTSITFPESLTAVGSRAFAQCFNLTNVILPPFVTTIGDYAFYGCRNITEMTIPAAITDIGYLAFGSLNCRFDVDPSNLNYMSSNSILFNKDQTILIQCVASISGTYEIPSSVTAIADYAFYNRSYLTSILIPSSLTSIGKNAFNYCSQLETVYIPSSVAFIGSYAFSQCFGIKNIYATSVVPINLDASPNVFLGVYGMLNVPVGSKTAYQTANQWKNFWNIAEINPDLIASAGPDQDINEGELVTLNGSVNINTSGKPLTYQWTAPAEITLSSATELKPTFTVMDVAYDQSFTFSLIVSDGSNYSVADEVIVYVRNVNKAPVANAGADQTVNENSLVTLDGSASFDPDGNYLNYEWIGPNAFYISSKYSSKATFTAPEVVSDSNFTFYLRIHDGYFYQTDTVVITVKHINKTPIAYAGNNQYKEEGEVVTLDGNSSMDPDGEVLTYLWTVPEGITLSSATSAMPSFTAPAVNTDTDFTFTLTVKDKENNSSTAEVTIRIMNIYPVLKLTSNANHQYIPVHYKLFKKEANSFIQKVDTFAVTGEILYLTLEPGEWITLALPARDPSAFIPTYSGDVLTWNEAKVILLLEKSVEYMRINCIRPSVTTTGTGQISGFVYEKALGGTKSISLIKEQNVQLASPVPNALVRLYKKDSTIPVASIFTDSQGAYEFNKLAVGDYEIMVEIPGFIQSDKFIVALSASAPMAKAYFGVDTLLKVITDKQSWEESNIKVYPNPTRGVVHISGLPESGKNKVSVFTMDGRIVVATKPLEEDKIDLSHQVPGIYLLMVNKERFRIIKK